MFLRTAWCIALCVTFVRCATITSSKFCFIMCRRNLFELSVCGLDSIDADCQLPLPANSFFAPLIFTPNGILKSSEVNSNTQEHYVRIAAGETVILSCTPNRFKFNPIQSLEATCKTGQTLSKLKSFFQLLLLAQVLFKPLQWSTVRR